MTWQWVFLADLTGPQGPIGPPGTGGYQGVLSTGADLNTYYGLSYDGYWAVQTDTIAASLLNAPTGAKAGTFHVAKIGSTASNQTYIEYGATGRMFVSAATSTGRSRPWQQITPTPEHAIAPTVGGNRVAPISVTRGWGGSTTTGSGFAKCLVTLPPKARRARIVIRNMNPRFTTADSASATLSTVSIGLSSGTGSSAQTGVVTVATGASTGTSGYYSPWFDASAFGGKDVIVGVDWSSAGTVQQNIGFGWTGSGTGATSTGATGSSSGTLPFHIYVETSIPASVPVIAAWGDSLSSGVGATRPVYDSWLNQFCRAIGAAAVHFTHSGDAMSAAWESTSVKWKEFGDNFQAADVAICAMGSNDVFGGADLTTMQTRLAAALPSLKRYVSPNVIAATITPRDAVTGSMEDVRRAYNTWLASQDMRQLLPFAATISTDDETINSGYNSDGIHFNTSGYGAIAAIIPHGIVTWPVNVDNTLGRQAFVWDDTNNRQQMVYGDTGARDITTDFDPSGSGGLCVISRSGNTVSLTLSGRTLNAASGSYTVPAGFRPDTTRTIASLFYPSAANNRMIVAASTGVVTLFGVTAGTAYWFSVSWRTADAWPTTLPGTVLSGTSIPA